MQQMWAHISHPQHPQLPQHPQGGRSCHPKCMQSQCMHQRWYNVMQVLCYLAYNSFFLNLTSWLGAPCGAHASISQIIYNTKIEKCWCKRSKTLDIYLF